MATGQTAATLDVRMRMETGEFVAGATKAAQETTKLKNAIAREMKLAEKELKALDYATQDYGKTVTKVAQMERELAEGRFKNLRQSEQGKSVAAQLLAQAAAYDKMAASTKAATKGLTEQQKIQLSYQLTDFVTQVGSGQNAMVAFLQQGGQFKDVMGGFGNTFRWLGTLFTPFRVAVGGAATALGVLVTAFYKGAKESADFRDSMILTSNFAGVTEQSITKLAESSSKKLNVSVGSARESLYALAASGKFTQESIGSVNQMILNLSKLTGDSAKTTAEKLIPSLDGSASSAKRLNDQYGFLTLAEYKRIEALEKAGDKQKAIKELTDSFNANVENQKRSLGVIEKAWNAIGNEISRAWDAIKGFGRENLEQDLAAIDRQIQAIHESQADIAKAAGLRGLTPGQMTDQLSNTLASLDARRTAIMAKIEAADKAARKAQEERRKIDDRAAAGGIDAELKKQEELTKAGFRLQLVSFQDYVDQKAKLEAEANVKIEELRTETTRQNVRERFQFQFLNAQILAKNELAIREQLKRDLNKIDMDRILAIAKAEGERQDIAQKAADDLALRVANATRSLGEKLYLEKISLDVDKERVALQNNLLFATDAQKKSAEQRFEMEKRIQQIEQDRLIDPQGKIAIIAQLRNLQDQRDAFNKLEESVKRVGDKWESVFSNMTRAIESFVRTGKMSFSDLTRSIIADILAMEMKAQASVLFRAFKGMVMTALASNTSFTTAPGVFDTGAVAYGRATGGPVSANTPYMVGERGPELFMPSGAGTIIPNHALGGMGGQTNITNYNISAIDVKSFEDRILGSSKAVWAANAYASKGIAMAGGRA